MTEKIFKKSTRKRLLSVVLALSMVLTLLPLSAMTVQAAEIEEHECEHMDLEHYIITGAGSSFTCSRYSYDYDQECWIEISNTARAPKARFPEGAAPDDGVLYYKEGINYYVCEADESGGESLWEKYEDYGKTFWYYTPNVEFDEIYDSEEWHELYWRCKHDKCGVGRFCYDLVYGYWSLDDECPHIVTTEPTSDPDESGFEVTTSMVITSPVFPGYELSLANNTYQPWNFSEEISCRCGAIVITSEGILVDNSPVSIPETPEETTVECISCSGKIIFTPATSMDESVKTTTVETIGTAYEYTDENNHFTVAGDKIGTNGISVGESNICTISSINGEVIEKVELNIDDKYGYDHSDKIVTDEGTLINNYMNSHFVIVKDVDSSNLTISTSGLFQYVQIKSVTIYYTGGSEACDCSSLTKQVGFEVSCTEDGWKDYYKCDNEVCGKLYTSEDKATEITDLEAWKISDGKIEMLGHAWNYTANESTITASCSRNCGQADVALTLTATSPNYSGIEGLDAFNAATGLEVSESDVKFYTVTTEGVTEGGTDETSTAPTAEGYYYASLTVEGVTAVMAFKVGNPVPEKAEGPEAPANLVPYRPTTFGGGDGKILGVDETMEYSTDGGENWTEVSGTAITDLEPGTVLVRVKETETTKEGASTSVDILNHIALIYVKEVGKWCLYEGGQLKEDYTGLFYRGDFYYIENGIYNKEYEGLTDYNGTLWYVKNGKLDKSFKGLADYQGTKIFTRDGKASYETGIFVDEDGVSYYIVDGLIDNTKTGLFYDSKVGAWKYFVEGVQATASKGLVWHGNAWYYVSNGQLDKAYEGLVWHGDAWYYVSGGQLDKSYAGLTNYGGKLWYVSDGKLNKEFAGDVEYKGAEYTVANGIGTAK